MPRSHHAEWLELVEVSGPFLTLPVLERVFPQGLDAPDPDHAAKLRLAHEEWAEERSAPVPDPDIHEAWIQFVLTETLELTPEVLLAGEGIAHQLTAEVPEQDTTLRPDLVIFDPEGTEPRRPRMLVQFCPPEQNLEGQIPDSPWAASPAERMTQLCRATEVRLGLLTNGERWMLVDAPRGETAGYVSFYASLFSDEPLTLRALRSLLGARRFFWVDESDTLEAMLAESATYQAEVTAQLGAQVRRAVEVLVQALDRADADTGRALLRGVPEVELYEAALTVMMRLVFLFFAEENDLLPLADELYQANYAASTLRAQLREEADRVGIEVLERRQDAWCRLLATFRAIHAGVDHEQLHLPAYGGSLFDPDRFCFLEGRTAETTWSTTEATPLPIDNRTVLHLLDALQLLQMKGRSGSTEARRLSFRSLDIEQIGHVYEMLLDHTAIRAMGPGLGLVGPKGAEPEVGLDELEELWARSEDALLEFLTEETKKSRSSIEKLLAKAPDPAWVGKLRIACGEDAELLERVLPFHALVRTDPWGDPVVIPTGAVYVTSGTERRSTGTYYTPKALTEEIVTYALEPVVYRGPAEGIPRQNWELLSPQELLDLKVCDPAMGSGAFLVQVVRFLSERLLEAWDKAEEAAGGPITPEEAPPTGSISELLVPTDPEERAALARRLIADRCIYGVDVNPLAVEMAKLSLWLVTLAKGRPFSFLDHSLRCGDSLLGIHDLEQIRAFHPHPTKGGVVHATLNSPIPLIEEAVARALEFRSDLESFTVKDVRDAERKGGLQHEAERTTEQVRLLGDLVIGAALSTAVGNGKGLDTILKAIAPKIPDLFAHPGGEAQLDLGQKAWQMLNAGKPDMRPDRRPFHWPVEFPEVFSRDRSGFDAVVGNPPFLGGKRISGPMGTDYREYLVLYVARGTKGNADLVAYFFLRAAEVIRDHGVFGVIATNTIAQGETRDVGLGQILKRDEGLTAFRAWKSRPWPGQSGVEVSVVWATRQAWVGSCVLDDGEVAAITAMLEPAGRVLGEPYPLRSNSGSAFQGTIVGGTGFLLTEDEARALIASRKQNSDVIRPYLNGEDVMTDPAQLPSRWVVCFWDWPLERAERYPEALQLVRERVRPGRLNAAEGRARANWWRFLRPRLEIYEAMSGLSRVLVVPRVAKHVVFSLLPTGAIFADRLVVVAKDDFATYAVLNSTIHQAWAHSYSSTFETRPTYNHTDVYETYPFPEPNGDLARHGERLHEIRASFMSPRGLGLTKTYNLVHDSGCADAEVQQIRDCHAEIDRSALDAYGWSDLAADYGFRQTEHGPRYTLAQSVRAELLSRLLELNHALQGIARA